jgi:phosphatidate cytidylyltransferase
MIKRITSTILLWGIILAALWFFGAVAAVWLLTILAALTLREFYQLAEKLGFRPFGGMAIGFSVLMTAGPYYLHNAGFQPDQVASVSPFLLALAAVVTAIRILPEREGTHRVDSLVATMIGLFYVPFMLHYFVRLLLIHEDTTVGLVSCLWVVAVSKFCDVGALLSGMAFGKHKMAPLISPKKTWEGAAGGVLISAGVGALVAWIGQDHVPDELTPLRAALIALPLAVITIVSDLIESAMKRRADLKDTGAIIPGIGGAFDLTDSLILTAPCAYVIFLFLK